MLVTCMLKLMSHRQLRIL